MPDYTNFMMRHGELGVLFIVEQIERLEGISPRKSAPLETRWNELAELSATRADLRAA